MNNLDLWNSVEKTNPSHTKPVTFGRKITAIDPYHQMKNATEKFGRVGIGWGWSVERVEYTPTNEIAVLVRLWHTDKQNTFDQWGQASLYIDKNEQKKDTDCFKKATTDGVTKCLSLIGFNADVFLGKFDDNKYVQSLNEEFAPKNKLITSGQAKEIRTHLNEVITEGVVCAQVGISKIEELHEANYNDCINWIKNQNGE